MPIIEALLHLYDLVLVLLYHLLLGLVCSNSKHHNLCILFCAGEWGSVRVFWKTFCSENLYSYFWPEQTKLIGGQTELKWSRLKSDLGVRYLSRVLYLCCLLQKQRSSLSIHDMSRDFGWDTSWRASLFSMIHTATSTRGPGKALLCCGLNLAYRDLHLLYIVL